MTVDNKNHDHNCNKLVTIEYEDLLKDATTCKESMSPLISEAFGKDGLGILLIRNIPSFVKIKQQFLPTAHGLSKLSPSYLEQNLVDSQSMYNSGWSHGKEKLGDSHEPDYAKASFYFNPITDVPGTARDRELYPASYPVNKWPHKDVVPGLEELGKEMGSLMRDVVSLVATHMDVYVNQDETENETENIVMADEMKTTEKVKGRLLYYFPLNDNDNANNTDNEEKEDGGTRCDREKKTNSDKPKAKDSWIGWHNDSGFFTALAGDIYVNHETGECISKDKVDPNAGLHIMNRNGEIVKVSIPEDCMGVQIGECLQIITGGKVVATPHCVYGVDPKWNCQNNGTNSSSSIGSGNGNGSGSGSDSSCGGGGGGSSSSHNGNNQKIARISFPCFVDTVPSFPLSVPDGSSREDVLDSSVQGCANIPPLGERWTKDGMDFGSFLQETFTRYYEWSNKT